MQQDVKVERTTALTNTKLDAIHTLVNSNMTAAMQAEFDSVQRELVLLKEVFALRRGAGIEMTTDAEAALKTTEARIADLRAALMQRQS
jgi:hypothetical protein